MAILENAHFRFITDKNTGAYHLLIGNDHAISLEENSISVKGSLKDGNKFHRQLALKTSDRPDTHLAPESLFLNFTGCEQDLGLNWEVRVSLAADGRLLQLKVACNNSGNEALYLETINLLQPLQNRQDNFQLDHPDGTDLRFYANGWQSWSYSGTYGSSDRMRSSNLGFLQEPMVLNPGTPKFKRRGKFSSDMFAALADVRSGQGIVLGFLSQKRQFGVLTADLRRAAALRAWAVCDDVRLDPGASLETDWFVVGLIDARAPFPFNPYLQAAARENDVKAMQLPPVGWCSWYHYYQDISEQKIMANLEQIQRIRESTPLNLFQIDDGFQEQVGDWLTFNEKFPHGVKPLADAVKQAGMAPGIWLAPFIVHPRSRLAREHPDWLLRRRNGSLTRAGFVWNALGLALDLTVPAALEYAVEVIRTAVQDWGFTYLKLDFLYAAALKGQFRDRTKTRAQVLRMAMHAVREAAGKDTRILGCGMPLGSALGLVDFMRVSADVGGHWAPDYFKLGFLLKREPHMPSACNAIHNTLTRAIFHNIWWVNDPDCLLVREDTALSLAEVHSLATAIALTGGSVLVSDDMQRVSPERLRIIQALIPPLNQRARVLDWLEPGTPTKMRLDLQDEGGEWHLLSFANWDDRPRSVRLIPADFGLEAKTYNVNAFWQKQSWTAEKGNALFTGTLQSHETILLTVRQHNGEAYFASNFSCIAPFK